MDRSTLKRRRSAIPPVLRRRYALRAWHHLRQWPELSRMFDIACYLGTRDEFQTWLMIKGLIRMGKRVYLPVVTSGAGEMVFQRYLPGDPLTSNRFGIAQPLDHAKRRIAPNKLNLVIMPLLGFDWQGHRLGMGGGFYDRSFAFRRHSGRSKQPFLLGLGYAVQACGRLTPQPWDVSMDGILTEKGIHIFKR